MQLLSGFVALVAVVQAVVAMPFQSVADDSLAPVPVTKLTCDGDTYKCTASLNYGDGRWVAQWDTAVFHTSGFGAPDHKEFMHGLSMTPVGVKSLACDGDTNKCTGKLDFGDGNWVAQWSTNIFHQGFRSGLAPVPANNLVCDGNTYKCNANLNFGDGHWVAQWNTNVFHTANFLEQ